MIKYLRIKLIKFLVKHLFNGIDEDDFLYIKGKSLYIGKTKLSNKEIKELASTANILKQSALWEILVKQIKLSANKKMFDSSTNIDDMYFGKAALYTIDLLDRKLDKLSRM